MADTIVVATAAMVGSEALGITNFTGIGGGSDGESPEYPSLPGGGVIEVPTPQIIETVREIPNYIETAGSTVRDTQTVVKTVRETVEAVPTLTDLTGGSGGSGGSSTDRRGGGGGGSNSRPDYSHLGPGGGPGWTYSPDSPGGSDYTMTESGNQHVRDAGAIGKAIGEAFGAVGDTVNGVGQWAGKTGETWKQDVNFLTGRSHTTEGTWRDTDSNSKREKSPGLGGNGAWWKGADPLNLGPKKGALWNGPDPLGLGGSNSSGSSNSGGSRSSGSSSTSNSGGSSDPVASGAVSRHVRNVKNSGGSGAPSRSSRKTVESKLTDAFRRGAL